MSNANADKVMFAFGLSLSHQIYVKFAICLHMYYLPKISTNSHHNAKAFCEFHSSTPFPKGIFQANEQNHKPENHSNHFCEFRKTIDVISISSESDSVPVPCRRWHMFCVSPKCRKVSSGLLSIVLVDCRFIGTILAFWLARETACLARSPLKYCRMAVASVVGQKECVSHTRTHSHSRKQPKRKWRATKTADWMTSCLAA